MARAHFFLPQMFLLVLLQQAILPAVALRRPFKHIAYLNYQEINNLLRGYAKRYKHVKKEIIGKTSERRIIQVVKIAQRGKKKNLPKILIDAGIHAREWASPAATLYFIEKLAKSFQRIPRKRRKSRKKFKKGHKKRSKSRWNQRSKTNVLEKFEWHILPLMNPDGYQYSRTVDRLWRKNTVRNKGSKCLGVDLNRNFGKGYGEGAGVSDNPCDENYKGPYSFSELESKAMRKYLKRLGKLTAGISVHSWGSYFLHPWGFTEEKHERHTEFEALGKAMEESLRKKETSWTWAEKIESSGGSDVQDRTSEGSLGNYTTMTGAELGVAGGATDDWYISKGATYSFTIELPGEDRNGRFFEFELPPSNIKWAGEQLWTSLTTMVKKIVAIRRKQ